MGHTPSFRLHKASGQGVTTIRGKVYYFGPFSDPESKQKYYKLMAEYFASNQSASFSVLPEHLSMAEGVVEYLEHAKTYYNASSEYVNLVLAAKPVMELYGDALTSTFGPLHYKTIRSWWMERGSSRQYINKQMKRLLRIVKWLVAEGKMPASVHQTLKCIDPLRRGRCAAPERTPVLPVDDDVVEKTIPHLSPVVAAMVRFQRLTGARPGEICSLKPNMFDKSHEVWEVRLASHKTAWRGKERTIYVGPQAQAVIAPYLIRDPDDYCFVPAESLAQMRQEKHRQRATPLSCGNRPGTNRTAKPKKSPGLHYTTQSYGRAIKYACLKAFPAPKGLSPEQEKVWNAKHAWAPNRLRHTLATAVRRTDGLEAAAVLLGHSEVGVTQVYAEADREKAIAVAKRSG